MIAIALLLLILILITVCVFAYKLQLKNTQLDKQNAIIEQEKLSLEKDITALTERIKLLQENRKDNVTNSIIEAINTKFTDTLKQMNNEKENALKSVLTNSGNMKDELIKQSTAKFEEIIKTFTNEITTNVTNQAKILKEVYFDTNKIKNAFTSSNKIGSFHESQLTVLLENMGFKQNQSFYTQFSTSDNLKPDAVIRLPNNDFIVIDCKSSAAFLPSENNTEVDDEKLATSMQRHINTLAKKDYFNSVLNEMKQKDANVSKDNARCSITLMYLPTDIALEKAQNAYDKKFGTGSWIIDCKKSNILPCGPSGLHSIIYIASHNISIEEANRNYSVNQDKIKNLLKEMNSMIVHIVKVGDYLSKTAESYSKFYKVWNGKFFKNATQFLSDDYTLEIKKMPEYHFAKGEEIEEIETPDAENKKLL
jgi:DNA anti-recombination protein RmuC